jgi:hypothetical protein
MIRCFLSQISRSRESELVQGFGWFTASFLLFAR